MSRPPDAQLVRDEPAAPFAAAPLAARAGRSPSSAHDPVHGTGPAHGTGNGTTDAPVEIARDLETDVKADAKPDAAPNATPDANADVSGEAEPAPEPPGVVARLLLLLVRAYQLFLSPLLVATSGPACRFEPSCSRYAAACLRTHGAWRGSLLSIVRVCKCHPFHPGGYDAPPPPRPPARVRTRAADAPASSAVAAPSKRDASPSVPTAVRTAPLISPDA